MNVSLTPYPSSLVMVFMCFLGAAGGIMVGIWRGVIYDFSPAMWTVAVLTWAAGFVVAFLHRRHGSMRASALLGMLLVGGFFLEVAMRKLGLSRELRTCLWVFGGGAIFTEFIAMTSEVVSRITGTRKELGRALRDPRAGKELEAYFSDMDRLTDAMRPFRKDVEGTFRKLTRKPGPTWQNAASALRAYIAAHDRYSKALGTVRVPACLDERARAGREIADSIRNECVDLARSLEAGERPDLARFKELNRQAVDHDRAWQYTVGMLAAGHNVRVPRWFLRLNSELQRAA